MTMTTDPVDTFAARADAVAAATGWDLDEYAADHEWSAVGLGPVGRDRDSGTLVRSNFDVVYADLRERFGDAVDSPRFGHWGVGWIDEIAFDAGNPDVVAAVEQWEASLADYPVANETAFCELEYAEAVELIAAIAPSYLTVDGVELERRDDLPDDWAEQTFSAMFDAGRDTSPDGMRGADVEAAMHELGFYVPED